MTPSPFDPLVHIDWKTPGSDLLGLLQHYYPDIGVFAGPGFETLLDELSNEMPEVCFEALAALLSHQGYDLWNLDAGGDDYRPVIFPSDQREAFAQHWQSPRGEPRFTPRLIEPPKPMVTEHKPAKTKRGKVNWLQEVHDYPGPTHVHEYNYRNGWAAITEQDEDRWLCFLIDYNQWPPVELDMLEQRTDEVDGGDLRLSTPTPSAACGDARLNAATTARMIGSNMRFAGAIPSRTSDLPARSGRHLKNPALWQTTRFSSASAFTSPST
ncbi:DUF6630 family protein [Pseudomonas sp. D3-10]|uniref:DUF6630 family protein n=1 Tax=Pseudomonas sp. D3-10 TaxID=2817392 RepID=UPI003DA82991